MVLIAVVLAPWLFGSSEPWAWLALGLWIILAAFFRLFGIFRESYVNAVTTRSAGVCLLLLACVAIQLTPLPARITDWLNPISSETQTTAARLLIHAEPESAAETITEQIGLSRLAISVAPAETRRALALLALVMLVFLTLLSSISDREEVEAMTLVLAANGLILAAFAIIQDLSDTRAIYGVYKPRLGGTFYGPFPNRNHFAMWMNLAIGCSTALLLASSRHALTPRFLSWGDRIALLSSRRVNVIVMLSYALVLMAAASILSLSRGGMVALAFGIIFMLVFYRVYRRHGSTLVFALVALLAVGGVVTWLGWRPILERLNAWDTAADPLSDTRWRMTVATLRMWAAAPIFGWGFGAFQHAFPMFQEKSLQVGRFVYAHNDYAQLLSEGGLLGLAAWIFAAVAFFVGAARGYRRSAPESRLFLIGLSLALCAVVIHSAVDFGLRRPANAFLFATVLAMALIVTRLPGYGRSYMYETGVSGAGVYVGALAVAAGLLALFAYSARELASELRFAAAIQWRQVMESTPSPAVRIEATHALAAEAETWAGAKADNPEASFELGLVLLKTVAAKDLPAELRIKMAQDAEMCARIAVEQAPADYEYWLWFSRILHVNGKPLLARFAAGRAQDLAPPESVVRP